MLSRMIELSRQDLNKIKDVHDLWIAKELEGNRSEVIDLCTQDIQWLAPNGRRLLLMKPGKLLKLAEGTGLEPA